MSFNEIISIEIIGFSGAIFCATLGGWTNINIKIILFLTFIFWALGASSFFFMGEING